MSSNLQFPDRRLPSTIGRLGCLILIHILTVLGAYGATVNVSSLADLQSAIITAASGDVVVLADGTYSGATINFASGRNSITVRSATPGGVYLNEAQVININGDYNTFSGFQFTSRTSTNGIIISVGGSHNLLTQLNFNGYKAEKYINLQGQYDEVAYCNFENKPTTAKQGNLIHIDPDPVLPGYHKIRYCSFKNMPGAGGDNGNECIRISNGVTSNYVSRTTVEFCYFNNTGLGDSEEISVKCRENVIRYNTFTNNQNAMVCFRNGDNNIAYGNFFLKAGGIRVKEANSIYCYNNYFESSGSSGTMGSVLYVYTDTNMLNNVNFIHNTFVECGTIDFDSASTKKTGNTWANNIFKKASGNIFTGRTNGISWAGNIYSNTLGFTTPSGMTKADPKLVLNSDGYYGLNSNSPAINSASANYPAILDIANIDDDPSLLLDISGQARPASVILKDVGCDEYGTNATLNRPLKLSEVGPSYLGGPGGAPSIATPPQSLAVNVGSSATFTVVATGGAPLAYQWRFNGTNLAGATATNYTIASAQTTNAGSYTVVVTNSAGSITSAVATLTINLAPSITTQPQSRNVNAGSPVSFSVVATNTTPLSYQWRKDGTNLVGATATNYSIASAQSSDAGGYTVVVTNVAGSVTSAVATLTVNVAPSITTQPQSQTVNAGSPVLFSVVATNTTPLSYQWRKDGTNLVGATATNYSITSAQTNDAGGYTVVVTNIAGSVTSDVATLSVRVLSPPQITQYVYDVNAGWTLSGTGPADQPWRALSATDITLPLTNWTQMTTGMFSGSLFIFTDPDTTNYNRRFYRVVTP